MVTSTGDRWVPDGVCGAAGAVLDLSLRAHAWGAPSSGRAGNNVLLKPTQPSKATHTRLLVPVEPGWRAAQPQLPKAMEEAGDRT